MPHKTCAQDPLYTKFLESRVESLEHRLHKFSMLFKIMLDLEDDEEDDEDGDEDELF